MAPAGAPTAVKLAMTAGNQIHTPPTQPLTSTTGRYREPWPAYDCSGATSFVLYEAGLFGASAETSAGFESYGLAGPGRWIGLYANSAHVWIVIAGIALDTAEYGGPPIPAGSGPRWRAEPDRQPRSGDRVQVARHPPGL